MEMTDNGQNIQLDSDGKFIMRHQVQVQGGPISGAIVRSAQQLPHKFRIKILGDYSLDSERNLYSHVSSKPLGWKKKALVALVNFVGLVLAWFGGYLFSSGTEQRIDAPIMNIPYGIALVALGMILQGIVNILWPLKNRDSDSLAILYLIAQQIAGTVSLYLATALGILINRGISPTSAIMTIGYIFTFLLGISSALIFSRINGTRPSREVNECEIDDKSAIFAIDFPLLREKGEARPLRKSMPADRKN